MVWRGGVSVRILGWLWAFSKNPLRIQPEVGVGPSLLGFPGLGSLFSNKHLSLSPACWWHPTLREAHGTHLIDDLHLDLLFICNGFLLANLLSLHAHHLDQLVCVFILLLQLGFLNG